MLNYKTNLEILKEYNKHIYGHLEAKKAIINLVNRSKLRYHQKYEYLNDNYSSLEPHKLLLVGKSGHGKTYLVNIASKIMAFPVIYLDATSLSPMGAKDGDNIDSIKKKINDYAKQLVKHDNRFSSVQGTIDQMVVFIDEIDKLARVCDSTGNWNRHIQESFLTLFESNNDDTYSGVSFIFAGAFVGLYEDIVKDKASMGFSNIENKTNKEIFWDKEVIKYGLVPELIGRIKSICKIDDLMYDDVKNILIDILIPEKEKELAFYGYTYKDLEIPNAMLESMIKKTLTSDQGIRYLKRELNAYFTHLEFTYEDKDNISLDDTCWRE